MMAIVSPLDLFRTALAHYYPIFVEYAKLSLLYIAAAGVMIQVIKSVRG